MIDELEYLTRGRPEIDPPSDDSRRAARRALERVIVGAETRPKRRLIPAVRGRVARLAPVAGLLVAVAVVAVFLGTHGRRSAAPAARGGANLVFEAAPTAGSHTVSHDSVGQAASLLRKLIAGFPGADHVSVSARGDRVIVHIPRDAHAGRAQLMSLAGMTGRLVLYDWEANALTAGGRSVASLLPARNPEALVISQGSGPAAPGSPGAGSLSLYQAVRLAAAQPKRAGTDTGRAGAEYFLFGTPAGGACGTAVTAHATRTRPAAYCYLAGPTATPAQALASLPAGVSAAQTKLFIVNPGTVVLQAVSPNLAHAPSLSSPYAQFYVLQDRGALIGSEVTAPAPGTDQTGASNVTFRFTSAGAAGFQRLTSRIAHRGDLVSGLGQTVNQHFAVALGDQLITVPFIDFRTYPDGIPGGQGGDVACACTNDSAKRLATEMRLGSLPIVLTLVS